MKVISDISNTIEELLSAAEQHIECAYKKKEEFPSVAQAYYALSVSEMTNIMALHEQVVKLIDDYRKKNGDPPERMMGRYEYVHERMIERSNKIKILQELFK